MPHCLKMALKMSHLCYISIQRSLLKGKKNWLDDVYEIAFRECFSQFSSTAHPLILKLLKLTRGS